MAHGGWHRLAIISALALAAGNLVAVPTVLLDRDEAVRVAAQGDTRPATTVAQTTTTELPTTTTAPPTTTTTRDPCRSPEPPNPHGENRYSPPESCGPFEWDPAPYANQPMNVSVTVSPPSPRVGEEVTFHVEAVDPDASPIASCADLNGPPNFGDGTSRCGGGCVAVGLPHYGKWPAPLRQRGTFVKEYRHAYSASGTYEFTMVMRSVDMCASEEPNSPWLTAYSSINYAKATVTVTE